MSYNTQMFHRFADDLERIADEVEGTDERMDEDDVYRMLDSLGRIMVSMGYGELTMLGLGIAQGSAGGMYEVFQELPEIKEQMRDYLLKEEGYELVSDSNYTLYIRKED